MIRLDADKLVKENRLRCCFVLTTISRHFLFCLTEKIGHSAPPPLPTNKVIINKINTKGKLLEHQVKFELIEAVCSPYIILNYVREKNDGVLDMQARKKGKELWSNG